MRASSDVLSREQLGDYVRDGWLALRGLMPDAVRESALLALDELDRRPAVPPGYQAEHEPGGGRLRKLRRLLWTEPQVWGPVAARCGAPEVATQLLGERATLIFHAAFLKPGQVGSEVALHQDQALWSRQYPGAFSIWFALSEVTEENGCLVGCPGSHAGGEIPHRDRPGYRWHASLDAAEDGLGSPASITLRPGDAAMWDRYFVHGSRPNRSGRDRRGMVMVFADGGAPGFEPTDRMLVSELAPWR